jgi:hypothetical protein
MYRGRGRGYRGRGTSHSRPARPPAQTGLDLTTFDFLLKKQVSTGGEIDNLKQFLMDTLVPLNIKFNIETDDSGTYVSLTTDRNGANFNVPLVRQSNGLIWHIDGDGLAQLVVVPSPEFNNSYSAIDIEQHLKDDLYNITLLEDGTTFNLYWFNGWHYATKNSRDCAGMEWRGSVYGELIRECFGAVELNVDTLDKNYVYTFGFNHPAHHPFIDKNSDILPNPKLWLIRAYDRVNLQTVEVDIGVPRQALVDLNKYKSPDSKSICSDLTTVCNDALTLYLEGHSTLLGFILRSKNPDRTGAVSDIMIESSLFQSIKRCIYDLPYIKNKAVRSYLKGRFKNFDYVIMNAWLDFTKRNVFFKLFPQFHSLQDRYNAVLEKTIDKIIPLLQSGGAEDPPINVFREATDEESASNLAHHMIPVLREKISSVDRHVIRDLIMHPKYTDTYVEFLCN